MKFTSRTLLLISLSLLVVCNAWSLPTTCGSTGLLNQPTAQTLNSGNICVSLWSDSSEWGQAPAAEYDATVVPFAITLGLGSFMEAYGSIPNLLFNDEETASGRGYSILGTKIRLFGKRSSPIQFSIDTQFRRAVSMDPDIDGLTDLLARGVVSFKSKQFGLHAWGGILDKEENLSATVPIGPFEDITGYGGGIEFFPTLRLRIIAEVESFSEAVLGTEATGEWMAGVQYFISPHLTFNVGYGQGMNGRDTGLSPESRLLVGFSSCQGIGSYSQVERKALPEDNIVIEEKNEPVKMLKIRTLSPLLNKNKPVPVAPVTPLVPKVLEPAPAIPIMPLQEFLEAPAAISAVELIIDVDAELIVLDPTQNIKGTEAYAKVAKQKSASPVGTPGMTATDRPYIDPTIVNKAKVYRRFLMPEFAFEVNKFELTPEGSAALSMIAVELSRDKNWYAVRVDGHTDSTGSDSYNQALSFSRAIEYAIQVTKSGFDSDRVYKEGFGESKPIATNDTKEGRALNRRVELLLLVPEDAVVPVVTEEITPEATEEIAPETTEEIAPEATEETAPETTEEIVPEATD